MNLLKKIAPYRFVLASICQAAALVALAASVAPARADSVANYTLFAGHSIVGTGGITANGGVLGSNGDLFLSGTTVQAVRGGGSLFDDFGGVDTTGDVTVNGDAQLTFFGNVGGNLNVGHNANLTANVGGNIVVGGDVDTTGSTTGGIFSGGSAAAHGHPVGGGIHPFSAVLPASYATLALPAAHSFTAGGASFTLPTFAAQTLLPGSYGDLIMIGSNAVNLSSGNYFFSDIRSIGSSSTINFDTTHGPINIFVTGDVFLTSPTMNLNGVSFGNIAPSAAGQIYWETHGNFRGTFASLLGTVYAPYGDVLMLKLSQSKGSLIAGNDIITDGGTFVFGTPSNSLQAVPEPSGLVLALGAALGLISMRRWRRKVNAG